MVPSSMSASENPFPPVSGSGMPFTLLSIPFANASAIRRNEFSRARSPIRWARRQSRLSSVSLPNRFAAFAARRCDALVAVGWQRRSSSASGRDGGLQVPNVPVTAWPSSRSPSLFRTEWKPQIFPAAVLIVFCTFRSRSFLYPPTCPFSPLRQRLFLNRAQTNPRPSDPRFPLPGIPLMIF
jgi:hypothetical protein